MAEQIKSRKYSHDRHDHLAAKERLPFGYYVNRCGNKWAVFSKRTGVRLISFDKKAAAEQWIKQKIGGE